MIILDNPDKDLAIEDSGLSEEEMIAILAEKVEAYLECNINLLMSYLYRLDVLEYKIKAALSNTSKESGHIVIAKLIWERQKERLETKKKYHSKGDVGDEWDW